jgi:hypothetical protein
MENIGSLILKGCVFIIAVLAIAYFTGYLDHFINFLRIDFLMFIRNVPNMLYRLPETIQSFTAQLKTIM